MGIIKQLPEDIAIKIAAGEVVERPASVVKELIENALDAGATKIEINLKDGGKSSIEIKDNGSGMDRDDAMAAFLRHGTSKITQVEDLGYITTLGFRGEALAAIGASAEVELITALTHANEGSIVLTHFGQTQAAKPYAPLPGTTIRVKNLFSSLPARQKFLKNEVTEWKNCLEIMTKQMIAHPEVGFIVKHNDRIVFDVPLDQEISSRVAQTWKIEQTKLIDVNSETPHMQLTGVVLTPQAAHEIKSHQFFVVNGHPVSDRMVARSIKDAFGTLLPPTIYPSYALQLRIHPGIVDVNIHPRKDEVRFVNPQEMYRFIFASLSQALEGGEKTFANLPPSLAPKMAHFSPTEPKEMNFPTPRLSFNATYTKRNATFDAIPIKTLLEVQSMRNETTTPVEEPIVTLANCYLVTIREEKLLLIDQHAAHERILYNKLWEQDHEKQVIRQPLLIPIELDFNESEQALFDEHKADFEQAGFHFANSSIGIAIQEVPQLVSSKEMTSFFRSLLSGLEDRDEPDLKDFKHKLFATMACKAAIKAGDSISETEKRQLIDNLLTMPDRFTCPHGRPSHIMISTSELEKLFKRTGF